MKSANDGPQHHEQADPEKTRAVYETHAAEWDRQRYRGLIERPWLDRFLAIAGPDAKVLDLGCGAGGPVARHLVEQGRRVNGVDFAAAMLAIARTRLPAARWLRGDMRKLDLAERFQGIVAWDSGPNDSEVTGTVDGAAVHHASLSPEEYARLLSRAGLELVDFVAADPACDYHSVLLARQA